MLAGRAAALSDSCEDTIGSRVAVQGFLVCDMSISYHPRGFFLSPQADSKKIGPARETRSGRLVGDRDDFLSEGMCLFLARA